MLPKSSTDWVSEVQLAELLNMARKNLREHRAKLPDGDWKVDGGGVLWRKKAAASLASELGITSSLFSEKDGPTASVEAGNGILDEVLSVHSLPGPNGYHFPNPRAIMGRRGNGETVLVIVVDSSRYTAKLRNGQPMTFKDRKSPDGNWWRLTGREPRFRGAW